MLVPAKYNDTHTPGHRMGNSINIEEYVNRISDEEDIKSYLIELIDSLKELGTRCYKKDDLSAIDDFFNRYHFNESLDKKFEKFTKIMTKRLDCVGIPLNSRDRKESFILYEPPEDIIKPKA